MRYGLGSMNAQLIALSFNLEVMLVERGPQEVSSDCLLKFVWVP
jgi:hypothetical protein